MRADSVVVNHAYSRYDVERLIAATPAPPPANVRTPCPARDAAIIHVLAHRGPRVSELTGLSVGDVDCSGDDPLLRIITGAKGGRRRTVPIPRPTITCLDGYLADRAGVGDDRITAPTPHQCLSDSTARRSTTIRRRPHRRLTATIPRRAHDDAALLPLEVLVG